MASRRTALGGAVLLLSIAAPATAVAAPAVAPVTPCIRYVETIPPAATLGVVTSGWAANTPLSFALKGRAVGSGTTDATGAFSTGQQPFTPPEPKGNLQTVALTAQDAAGTVATTQVKLARLIVTVPSRAKPSKRVKYRAFGFAPHKRLYLFVRHSGKTKKRILLGKTKGECGLLTKKLRYMPLKNYTSGLYEYWFSHSKTYSKATRIYRFTIQISRS